MRWVIIMDAEKRIQELIDLINYHNEKYYNQDAPEIEDFEYDNLMKELIKLEEENPSLKRKGNVSWFKVYNLQNMAH